VRHGRALAGLVVAVSALVTGGCTPHDAPVQAFVVDGDVARGRVALRQYACGTGHVIPGVTGADALVGPPLNGIGTRHYVGGVVQNTPENMVRWIRNPQGLSPLSAMPNLGVSEGDALDMAAYLYTLQ
jgi:cytochrome c